MLGANVSNHKLRKLDSRFHMKWETFRMLPCWGNSLMFNEDWWVQQHLIRAAILVAVEETIEWNKERTFKNSEVYCYRTPMQKEVFVSCCCIQREKLYLRIECNVYQPILSAPFSSFFRWRLSTFIGVIKFVKRALFFLLSETFVHLHRSDKVRTTCALFRFSVTSAVRLHRSDKVRKMRALFPFVVTLRPPSSEW